MLYENVRTYRIERRISFCQNPDLNRRTDKTPNLDKVSQITIVEHANIS